MNPTAETSPLATERRAWLALAAVEGVGEGILTRLVAAFGSARHALAAARAGDDDQVGRRLGGAVRLPLSGEVVARLRLAAMDPDAVVRRLTELDGWALTPFDADWPARLRAIDGGPVALFGTGDKAVLDGPPCVAMVGTRRPTVAGRALASRLAATLAANGVVVVSGLAVGIDGAAHAATLAAAGRTVAVIGGGLAAPGPRAHRALAAAIRESGAIVGEHAPDAVPTRGTFPRRNRIISGLCDATVVVEAPLRSGALITARHALEQGRAVFAAPGRPGDPAVAGCLALLRETPARPVVGAEELLADLVLIAGAGPGMPGASSPRASAPVADLSILAPPERSVAEGLLRGAASADVLVARTGLSAAVVAGALTLLQLRGWSHVMGALHLAAGPLLHASVRLRVTDGPGPRATELDAGPIVGGRTPA